MQRAGWTGPAWFSLSALWQRGFSIRGVKQVSKSAYPLKLPNSVENVAAELAKAARVSPDIDRS